MFKVAEVIAFELWGPISHIGFGDVREDAAMLVPETAVNEDNLLLGGESKVRFAGKTRMVKPVTVAHAMNKPPYQHLRLSIL